MRRPDINDLVLLNRDLPDLYLRRGTIGIVRSTWCAPLCVYEVEFTPNGDGFPERALLLEDDLELYYAVGQRQGSVA
jgi:hypothetical protein